MLDGVERIEWYDDEIPEWLHSLADGSGPDDEAEFLEDVPIELMRESEICDDSVKAVPFLVRLAAEAPRRRGPIAGVLAMIVSRDFETPVHSDRARAAVAEHIDTIVALAGDADTGVRKGAYLVLGRCGGPAEVLLDRWRVEPDVDARTALLLGLVAHVPDVVESVLFDGSPKERLAAGVALRRAGRPFPAGAAAALASAVSAGADLEPGIVMLPVRELVAENQDEAFVAEYEAAIVHPDEPGMADGGSALIARCGKSRSAPQRLVPGLGPLLLNGPDPETRKRAMLAVAICGRAAATVADELAELTAALPGAARDTRAVPEFWALKTLVRLNDARWIDPARRFWAAGLRLHLDHEFGFAPVGAEFVAALAAALARVRDDAAGAGLVRTVADLAVAYRPWKEQAARLRPLEPALRAVAGVAPGPVARALYGMGAATIQDLRTMIGEGEDRVGLAAVELFHRSWDVRPLVDTLKARQNVSPDVMVWLLRRALAPRPGRSSIMARLVLGQFARRAPNLLTIESGNVRLAAAQLRLRVGDPGLARELVPAALERTETMEYAATLAVQLRDPALEPLLRNALTGKSVIPAAEALVAVGVDRSEVAGPVLEWLRTCDEFDEIVRVGRALLDPAVLRDLADRDERVAAGMWQDERHRDAAREAVRGAGPDGVAE